MTAPNETPAMWAEIRHERQEVGQERKTANLAVLRASTIPFEFRNGGDVVLVRDKAYPNVDFYPTKNRWTIRGREFHGDARALVDWLWLEGPKRGKVGR